MNYCSLYNWPIVWKAPEADPIIRCASETAAPIAWDWRLLLAGLSVVVSLSSVGYNLYRNQQLDAKNTSKNKKDSLEAIHGDDLDEISIELRDFAKDLWKDITTAATYECRKKKIEDEIEGRVSAINLTVIEVSFQISESQLAKHTEAWKQLGLNSRLDQLIEHLGTCIEAEDEADQVAALTKLRTSVRGLRGDLLKTRELESNDI